jgi:hypothetical protein
LWSYGSWIYNYLCNQHLSPLNSCSWQGVLDTTLCDKACQWKQAPPPVQSSSRTEQAVSQGAGEEDETPAPSAEGDLNWLFGLVYGV